MWEAPKQGSTFLLSAPVSTPHYSQMSIFRTEDDVVLLSLARLCQEWGQGQMPPCIGSRAHSSHIGICFRVFSKVSQYILGDCRGEGVGRQAWQWPGVPSSFPGLTSLCTYINVWHIFPIISFILKSDLQKHCRNNTHQNPVCSHPCFPDVSILNAILYHPLFLAQMQT